MNRVQDVRVGVNPLDRFAPVVGEERMAEARQVAESIRARLDGRVLWNVNSTAVGGGVAEMLRSLVAYGRGVGVDVRWLVITGNPEFFRVTKRLHHALHGERGDGSELGDAERAIYESTLRANARELAPLVKAGDVVLLHDPQTAGLAPYLARSGALVIWRSHVGSDEANAEVERAWRFLVPYLHDHVPAYVFTRDVFVPDFADHGKATVIQPSIDAFSAKNQELSPEAVRTILVHTGLVEGPPPPGGSHGFLREDGSPARVERKADVFRMGRAPAWETPLVVQVSRWDPLKDPVGVMRGFAELVNGHVPGDAELVLAGPNVHGVADDPEAAATLEEALAAWRALPHTVRDRVHLASLPTADVEENAAIVNALQRHAAVVVQKSLREGFGLTVTEAMWKARPVLASAVGGIQDQIEDGVNGLLLKDPTDLADFGAALRRLLDDPAYARRLGDAALETVRERFLGIRHLIQYARLIERLDGER